jgi:putative FmdB family regulatory protein
MTGKPFRLNPGSVLLRPGGFSADRRRGTQRELTVPIYFDLCYERGMPIYEYECRKCGETIEVIQRMTEADPKKHQGCGGTLTRLLSVPRVRVRDAVAQSPEFKHLPYQQQVENEIKRKESQKAPKRIIHAPSSTTKQR